MNYNYMGMGGVGGVVNNTDIGGMGGVGGGVRSRSASSNVATLRYKQSSAPEIEDDDDDDMDMAYRFMRNRRK